MKIKKDQGKQLQRTKKLKKASYVPMFINNIISIVKTGVCITKSDIQVHCNPFKIPMRGLGVYLQQALSLIPSTTQTYCFVKQYSNTRED